MRFNAIIRDRGSLEYYSSMSMPEENAALSIHGCTGGIVTGTNNTIIGNSSLNGKMKPGTTRAGNRSINLYEINQ